MVYVRFHEVWSVSVKKQLLVVDDDPDIREALTEVLSSRYGVVSAGHGGHALEYLEAHPVDAVVLDLMMPVMDGAELMRQLASRDMKLPIVLVSASPEVDRVGRELGAAAWLEKPFSILELLDTLERVTAVLLRAPE